MGVGGGRAMEDGNGAERIREPGGLKAGTWDKVVDEGKKYLLEVNPHFIDTSTGDLHNKIDARWIDTSTGLFIDVTTVHPVPSDSTTDAERRRHKFFRAESTAQTQLAEPEEMYTKDTHLYTTASLFPLRRSKFEGTPVFVPYAYEQLLIEEYGPRALTQTWFNGYKFDQETKEWDVAPEPAASKGKGDRKDGAGRPRKGGKKPKWKPVDDKERNKKDNQGNKVYTPKPGGADDVHIVPAGAA
ncbi:mannosyltransferase [Didymella sp. IMI 355093]|nr:mannosyltransferase [Didymella sp. IMI 355093]